MSKREFFSRYLFIIKRMRQKSYTSFDEIKNYVSQELELNGELRTDFSQRTFQRDIAEIYSLFNIEILYSRSEKGYYIAEDLDRDMHFSRMIEAFDILQSFNQMDSIKSFFHFEERRPLGTDFIKPLVQAIKGNQLVHFIYYKNWQQSSKRIVEPLVLKEYKTRWYLVGREKGSSEIKTFALDRVENLFATGETFVNKKPFSAKDYFQHCFGIYRPNDSLQNPEEIIVETNKTTGNYLLSQPMHVSQKLINETETGMTFSIFVFKTFDLEMELLSYGKNVQIISPQSLKEQLEKIHLACLEKKG